MMSRRAHVTPYWWGNTPSAIKKSAQQPRFTAHELDVRIDADGEIWCLHWWKPLEHDYRSPSIPARTPVADMTTAQVRTLRTATGVRAYRLEECLTAAAHCGLVACLELKPGHAWTDPATWARIRAMVDRTGATVQAEAVPSTWDRDRIGRARANAAAKRAGFGGKWNPPLERPEARERPVKPKEPPRIEQAYTLLWQIIIDAQKQGKHAYAGRVWLIAAMFNRLRVRPQR